MSRSRTWQWYQRLKNDGISAIWQFAMDRFIDPGHAHVHNLRNEGGVEARTITVQLLPAGAPPGLTLRIRGTGRSNLLTPRPIRRLTKVARDLCKTGVSRYALRVGLLARSDVV